MSEIIAEVNLRLGATPLTGTVTLVFPPELPVISSNTFTQHKIGPHMAVRTGTVQITSPVDPTVTSQPVTITGSTVAGQSPVTVDAKSGGSFQANDGDVLTETGIQINAAGSSPPSSPVYIVVAAGVVTASPTPPPPALPAAPVIGTNTFV